VDGEDNVALAPQMPGVVTSVNVKEGDKFIKPILAQLDDNVLQQQIAGVNQQLAFATTFTISRRHCGIRKSGQKFNTYSQNSKESLEKNLATLQQQLEMSRIKSPN